MIYAMFDRDAREIDSRGYVAALRSFSDELPTGARQFMMDPAHFDYGAYRTGDPALADATPLCPKDLKLVALSLSNEPHGLCVETTYLFPGYPLGQIDLFLRYVGVTSIVVRDLNDSSSCGDVIEPTRLGRWMVDEAVVNPSGVRHEIAFEDGLLIVDCSDFEGSWR